jgi:hypothetical protein
MDEMTGHRLRPGAEGWFREEGEAYIKINQDGWRDIERSKEKAVGVKRIAILGDSYAEALQVPQERTFWSVLERGLNSCNAFGNMRAEVMNFGVSGYGTAQELLLFQKHVSEYSPDIVVLAFTTGNDVRDNSKQLSSSMPRPYFFPINDSLTLDNSFLESGSYRVKQSGIWRLVQKASDSMRVIQLVNIALNRVTQMRQRNFQQSEGPTGLEPGFDDNVYREPERTEWKEAWRVTEELIVNIRDEVVVRGAQFLLVSISSGIQVHPNAATRASFVGKLGVTDLLYPERRLEAFGKREKFDVFTLSPHLLHYAEERQLFLHGFKNTRLGQGHWNEEGHRLAGEIIAKHFCPRTV